MPRRKIRRYKLENSPFYNETLKSFKRVKLEPLEYDQEEDIYITKKVIYKSEEYVKMIIPKDINITSYHRLSKLATTLLYYIVTTKLEYNSPTFRLKVNEFTKVINLSTTNRVYEAITELVEEDYIKRTSTREVYWINHNRYYKGSYITIKELVQK